MHLVGLRVEKTTRLLAAASGSKRWLGSGDGVFDGDADGC
jgi:hypothetical protein